MKLKVQVIKEYEEYHRLYQLWEDDPLIYQKPDVDIEYENMVIRDKDIYAYKVTKSLGRDDQDDIVIYTDAPHFEIISVDYDTRVIEVLDLIMEQHNLNFINK
jgi:hypothetical protein